MKQKFSLWASKGVPSSYARCMNPRCTKRIEYREERSGRQKDYCDDACRVQTSRDYESLTSALSNISIYGEDDPQFLSKIYWHLERYHHRTPAVGSGPDRSDKEPALAAPRRVLQESAETSWLLPMLSDRALAKSLAKNELTLGEVLSQLAQDADPAIRSLVASNPTTEPYVLEVLCQDPRPRVRECAARNPSTPDMARKRVFRDRSRRVRLAAQEAEQEAARRSRVHERKQNEVRRVWSELRDPGTYAQTTETVLTWHIAEALDLVGQDIDVARDFVKSALKPLRGQIPSLIPVDVTAERQFQKAQRRLSDRRKSKTKPQMGDAEALCIVPGIATWAEALSDWIVNAYSVNEQDQEAVIAHLSTMFAALGRTEPLTQDQVRFVPRFVRQHAQQQPAGR